MEREGASFIDGVFPLSYGSTAAGECVNWKGAMRMKYVGKRLRARNT